MSKDGGNDDDVSSKSLAVGTKATKKNNLQLVPRYRRCLWLGMVLLGVSLAMIRYNSIVISPYSQRLESEFQGWEKFIRSENGRNRATRTRTKVG